MGDPAAAGWRLNVLSVAEPQGGWISSRKGIAAAAEVVSDVVSAVVPAVVSAVWHRPWLCQVLYSESGGPLGERKTKVRREEVDCSAGRGESTVALAESDIPGGGAYPAYDDALEAGNAGTARGGQNAWRAARMRHTSRQSQTPGALVIVARGVGWTPDRRADEGQTVDGAKMVGGWTAWTAWTAYGLFSCCCAPHDGGEASPVRPNTVGEAFGLMERGNDHSRT